MTNSAQEARLIRNDAFKRGKALFQAGDLHGAVEVFSELTRHPDDHLRALRRRADCYLRLQDWPNAERDIRAVADHGVDTLADYHRLLWLETYLGDEDACSRLMTEYAARYAGGPEAMSGRFVVLVAATLKTGSSSFADALAAALGYPVSNHLSGPPTLTRWGQVDAGALDASRGIGLVNHGHIGATAAAAQTLATRDWVKVALHLRHPLETITSTIDAFIRAPTPTLVSTYPDIVSASAAEVKAWSLAYYAPHMARWMCDWLALHDAGHPAIFSLSTMDEMKADGQDALARRVTARLPDIVPKEVETPPRRYKLRLTGAQRVSLTHAEATAVLDLFPSDILARFKWSLKET